MHPGAHPSLPPKGSAKTLLSHNGAREERRSEWAVRSSLPAGVGGGRTG